MYKNHDYVRFLNTHDVADLLGRSEAAMRYGGPPPVAFPKTWTSPDLTLNAKSQN